MNANPFAGTWTYRSLLNDPDVTTDFDHLEFGRGTLVIRRIRAEWASCHSASEVCPIGLVRRA